MDPQSSMKHSVSLLLFLLTAVSSYALNNSDIIKMHRAGLDADTIVLAMEKESADYDVSTDGLIELKQAKVPENVIQAAIILNAGGTIPSSSEAQGAAPTQTGVSGQGAPSVLLPEIQPVEGKTYFTRISMWYEKNKHIATNYERGTLLPINSEVEFLGVARKGPRIKRIDTGEVIYLENVPEYSGKSNHDLAARYLSDRKTTIEKLPSEIQDAIRAGQLRLGMTKEQAILARGYPPSHKTPSIEGDRWVFWSSRFVQQTIVFQNGSLVEGRGLY